MASTLIDGVDDNDPRLKKAMRALEATVSVVMSTSDDLMTPENIARMGAAIAWHRQQCKDKLGLDMPVLTAVALPRMRFVRIVRADLPRREIENLIIDLARQFEARNIQSFEIAVAIAAAFPDYRVLQ